MTERVTDTALATTTERSQELVPTSMEAEKQHEIQSAIIIAKRFPRNEDQAFEKLTRACKRPSFADEAAYSFPRGKTRVTGPSVNLAREAARVWGNIRYGVSILRDDEDTVLIQGWAWDMEENIKVTAEDSFKKLVYRKDKGWVKPDERDLRELINRRGAIAIRNSLLQILPKDLVEDAMSLCRQTLKSQASQDPDLARKKLILAFSEFNVTPEMLDEYLGHPLKQADAEEIANLRQIYKSIKDGNSTWHEYINGGKGKEAEEGKLKMDDLKKPKPKSRKREAKPKQPEPEPNEESNEELF